MIVREIASVWSTVTDLLKLFPSTPCTLIIKQCIQLLFVDVDQQEVLASPEHHHCNKVRLSHTKWISWTILITTNVHRHSCINVWCCPTQIEWSPSDHFIVTAEEFDTQHGSSVCTQVVRMRCSNQCTHRQLILWHNWSLAVLEFPGQATARRETIQVYEFLVEATTTSDLCYEACLPTLVCIHANKTHLFVFSNVHGMSHVPYWHSKLTACMYGYQDS